MIERKIRMKKSHLGDYFRIRMTKYDSKYIVTKEYKTVLPIIEITEDALKIKMGKMVNIYALVLRPKNYNNSSKLMFRPARLIYEVDNILYDSQEKIESGEPLQFTYFIPNSEENNSEADIEHLQQSYDKTEASIQNSLSFVNTIFKLLHEDYLAFPYIDKNNDELVVSLQRLKEISKRLLYPDFSMFLEVLIFNLHLFSFEEQPVTAHDFFSAYLGPNECYLLDVPRFNNWPNKKNDYCLVHGVRFTYLKNSYSLDSFHYDYEKNLLILEKRPHFIPDKIFVNWNGMTIKYSSLYPYFNRKMKEQRRFYFKINEKIQLLISDCSSIDEKEDSYELSFHSLPSYEVYQIISNLYFDDIEDYDILLKQICNAKNCIAN